MRSEVLARVCFLPGNWRRRLWRWRALAKRSQPGSRLSFSGPRRAGVGARLRRQEPVLALGGWAFPKKKKLGYNQIHPCLLKETKLLTYEDIETVSFDPEWEQQVMKWCLWNRLPLPLLLTPCALSVASSTGPEKTTCTITRMRWMMTLSATFAFSPCCSHWTHPVDIHSATSASETFYKRKIFVHWTGKDFTSSCVRSLAF